jgi:hypothetical protein
MRVWLYGRLHLNTPRARQLRQISEVSSRHFSFRLLKTWSRALRKVWALAPWVVLVILCGLAIAAIVVEAVVAFSALVGH